MFVKRISTDGVVIGAPAKVNLFLHVNGRRDDGYHDIHSIFQAVSLFDRLKIRKSDHPDLRLSVIPKNSVPTDGSNLIDRAWRLMAQEFGLTGSLEIELEKNIPVAAGLAGGSADAAATILACNILYDLGLDAAAMADLGLKIGSDLPFFFSSGQAEVSGRGELIVERDLPRDYWLVLVTPPLAISTAESYAQLSSGLTNQGERATFESCNMATDLADFLDQTRNDFETIHLRSYPQLGEIRGVLLDAGARIVRMSGSGPTMFGMFTTEPETAIEKISGRGDWNTALVRPVSLPAPFPELGRPLWK